MKKTLLFLITIVLIGCAQDGNYTIKGIFESPEFENSTVYLKKFHTNEMVDSSTVKNKKFTFKGNVETTGVYNIICGKKQISFILETGNIQINTDLKGHTTLLGTPLNDKFDLFSKEGAMANYERGKQLNEANQKTNIDYETRKALTAKINQDFSAKNREINEKYFEENKDNVLGAYILYKWYRLLDGDELARKLSELAPSIREDIILKNINSYSSVLLNTSAGRIFTDFTVENGNIDGSSASLSDYVGKGKYILVDFWASWCGPCQAEIPVLKDVYKKHKGNKFDILSVAVWDKREATLKALKEHKLPWLQIIDGQKQHTDLYAILGIPQIILFGPDGIIIARDLRGDALKAKVAEVLK